MFSNVSDSIINMNLNEYGIALEKNVIVSLNKHGFIIDASSGNIISSNEQQLDLLIAYLESLRKKMNMAVSAAEKISSSSF
ncbi:TPA: hypothetical protein NPP25_004948 [Klebsiella quasipneumoniae subsp. similipneumoniae]|uniref:hypothetical protein n=1 Tax=Klebsiella quasipneumoniae TaxID=1463165 RepID=UPI0010827C6F|nr:hypothetical protein [Klebsiella quasipneumoniae]HCI4574071.1 hypothetical protein [Klebsiella quasipneumoniae subsp. similipneumoniae]VGC12668.1 Uncharacterised protein [Klebsiella quasipneumoniae]HCI4622255.1 hypothetical protein [Klebsiella quasipneumoniae subsp. similipneumoniae]HCI4647847.1 hypothetical protein [Klebsiella quasipneumoniae subsp. similipneumoniae]HCI6410099.1 hypothetical protein [Klebsiella quasipneumoniae subsp. similipneumoniae]